MEYATKKDFRRLNKKVNKHINKREKEATSNTENWVDQEEVNELIKNKVKMLGLHQKLDLDDEELISMKDLLDKDKDEIEKYMNLKDKRTRKKFKIVVMWFHKHRRVGSVIGLVSFILWFFFGVSLLDIFYGLWVGAKLFYGFF